MTIGKVVVVGRGEAGKSTLIAALAGNAMNLEVRGRTVAMDHGTLVWGGHTVSLVGVPGQRRFAPVREFLVAGADAAVWVHPAGERPDQETLALIQTLSIDGVPYVVFVNKRADSPRSNGFVVPADRPRPCAIVHGDLSAPGASLEELRAAIWELLGHGALGLGKENR